MALPEDRRYAATHEWARLRDGEVEVGITETAQQALGDLVFVGDVPVGEHRQANDVAGLVESVKAASEIHAPVAGRITAFNTALSAEPDAINDDAFGTWIFRMKADDADDLAGLMDAEAYARSAGD